MLRAGHVTLTQVTDVHGAYAFESVPLGSYDVTYALNGLQSETRSASVRAGANVIPVVEMNPGSTSCETVIEACGKEPPSTRWDRPSCDDFELDTALIDNAKRGDGSAIDLLRQRYAATFTYSERFRIGGSLLGRARDDAAIWNELAAHAERLVDVGGDREKLEAYCAAHGYSTDDYENMAWGAFVAIMDDRRARPLLLRALASDDSQLALMGLIGLADQHDDTPLAEIEATVRRYPELVLDLADFHSDAIDALAMKHLKNDEDRADYLRHEKEDRH